MNFILYPVLLSGWVIALILHLRRLKADRRYNTLLDEKLEGIRTLVDGTLITTMHSELNALKGQVVLMRRINDLTKPASEEDVSILEGTEKRVAELAERISSKEKSETRQPRGEAG